MRYYKSHKFISRAISKCKRLGSNLIGGYVTITEAKLLSDLFKCKPANHWLNIDNKFTKEISSHTYWAIQPQTLTKVCEEYGIDAPKFFRYK